MFQDDNTVQICVCELLREHEIIKHFSWPEKSLHLTFCTKKTYTGFLFGMQMKYKQEVHTKLDKTLLHCDFTGLLVIKVR